MNRDKQIEEMAKIAYEWSDWNFDPCKVIAENIYNANYRKASDVAREIFEEIEKKTEFGRIMNDCAIVSLHTLAELKKKYTGEDTNVTTNTEEG